MITIFKTWVQKNYISIPLHIVNQFHTKCVFFSNSRDGRNVAIAYTLMEQLYQCADITFVLFLEKMMTVITNVILIFYNSSINY